MENAKRISIIVLMAAISMTFGAVYDFDHNLVANGDAESSFDHWSFVVNCTIAPGDSAIGPGTKSFEANASGTSYTELVHSTILLAAGERVLLSLSFKTLEDAVMGSQGAMVYFRYYTETGQWLGQDTLSLALTQGQWQPFSAEFAAMSGTHHVDIYFSIGKWGPFDGIARIDNVTLYREIPAASTSGPVPEDNTKFHGNDISFSWTAGDADGYDVYLGDFLPVLNGLRLFADLDLNGLVGLGDVERLALNWLDNPVAPTERADLSNDLKVDEQDFRLLAANWLHASDVFAGNSSQNAFTPAPLPLSRYSWRVDNVYGGQPQKGPVWNINASYAVLDDIESYSPANPIQDHWTDGAVNNSGAAVTLTASPVHDGTQALSLSFDNRGTAGRDEYSQIQRTFTEPRDWSALNADLLWIHFYGPASNALTENDRPYVSLEDSDGRRATVFYPRRLSDWQIEKWRVWQTALDDFTGVNLAAVKKIAVGLGGPDNPQPGTYGTVILDDIYLVARHNQLFPQTPPPVAAVDYIDLRSAPADMVLAAVTLQGQVNSGDSASLYLLLNNADVFWRDRMTAAGHFGQLYLKSIDIAFNKYYNRFDKVVVYDPALPATINIATMIASVERGVVIAPSDIGRFGAGKPVDDLRGRWSTNLDAYTWAYENLWPRMRHDILAIYHPTATVHHIRDYLVQNRVFTLWVTGDNVDDGIVSDYAAEKAFAEMLFADTPVNTPVIGWIGTSTDAGLGEYNGVGLMGEYGKLMLGCDWTTNMSILSGMQVDWHSVLEQFHARPRPPKPALDESKVYMLISVIDAGDAPVYWQGVQHLVWQDSRRGTFPIGWSLGPGSLELLPGIMEWFYTQATSNDHFFFAPSGGGYVHPYRNFMSRTTDPEQAWAAYLHLTDTYMKWLGVEAVSLYTTAWNTFDRQVYDPTTLRFVNALENLELLILGMGRDQGITEWNYTMGDDVHVSHTTTQWDSSNIGRNQANRNWLVNEIQTHTPPDRPAFMIVYPISWSYWPTDLENVLSQLGSEYVPVNPEQFKTLYKESLN